MQHQDKSQVLNMTYSDTPGSSPPASKPKAGERIHRSTYSVREGSSAAAEHPQPRADRPTTSSSHSQSHQFVSGISKVRLLVAVVVGRPAVGHQEVEDGRVVGDLRTSPAHHQSTSVHVLHLHVDGSAAANWEEDGGESNAPTKERRGDQWRTLGKSKGKGG